MTTDRPSAKKPWSTPILRSEAVQETLAQPACSLKPPGQGGPPRPPTAPIPLGPAFS
jgi:hypothetical protein